MLGLECKITNTEILAACYEKELLVVPAADNILRLLPPLNIADEDIAEALTRLDQAARSCEKALDKVQP